MSHSFLKCDKFNEMTSKRLSSFCACSNNFCCARSYLAPSSDSRSNFFSTVLAIASNSFIFFPNPIFSSASHFKIAPSSQTSATDICPLFRRKIFGDLLYFYRICDVFYPSPSFGCCFRNAITLQHSQQSNNHAHIKS